MGRMLDALQRLQAVEHKLGELRGGEAAKRRQVQACERQLQKFNRVLEDKTNEIRRTDAEIHNTELEVNSREATIQKHRIALNQAKTNKEYAAILTTINTEKADTSKFENRVLKLMTLKDGLQDSYNELVAQRDKLLERRGAVELKLKAYVETTREELEHLVAERREISAALPPTVMSTFDRAAEHHEGEALAIVTKVNPKRDEYVCGGCHMAMTLETVNALRTHDEVVLCSICGRIMCFEEGASV